MLVQQEKSVQAWAEETSMGHTWRISPPPPPPRLFRSSGQVSHRHLYTVPSAQYTRSQCRRCPCAGWSHSALNIFGINIFIRYWKWLLIYWSPTLTGHLLCPCTMRLALDYVAIISGTITIFISSCCKTWYSFVSPDLLLFLPDKHWAYRTMESIHSGGFSCLTCYSVTDSLLSF